MIKKNQIWILFLLFGLFSLSGCISDWHGSEQIYIDLHLVSEVSVDTPCLNVTNVNLTRYPTLKQAINALIPPENRSSVSLKISSEEHEIVVSELLRISEDLLYFHISYSQYYFNIGFSVN
jgi:hypothetical protein